MSVSKNLALQPSKEAFESFLERINTRIYRSGRNIREAILKTHLLNLYELMTLGCGLIIQADQFGKLFMSNFEEVFATDRKEANTLLLKLRARLMKEYPAYFPNFIKYPIQFQHVFYKAADRPKVIEEYERVLDNVRALMPTSIEYLDLHIDAKFDPINQEFMNINSLAWHILVTYFDGLYGLYQKTKRNQDADRIIEFATDLGLRERLNIPNKKPD